MTITSIQSREELKFSEIPIISMERSGIKISSMKIKEETSNHAKLHENRESNENRKNNHENQYNKLAWKSMELRVNRKR